MNTVWYNQNPCFSCIRFRAR